MSSTPSATLYFAVYSPSPSRTDFRWVCLFRAFVNRTQFGCIGKPSKDAGYWYKVISLCALCKRFYFLSSKTDNHQNKCCLGKWLVFHILRASSFVGHQLLISVTSWKDFRSFSLFIISILKSHHIWSLQSDWLSAVWFIHESHLFFCSKSHLF